MGLGLSVGGKFIDVSTEFEPVWLGVGGYSFEFYFGGHPVTLYWEIRDWLLNNVESGQMEIEYARYGIFIPYTGPIKQLYLRASSYAQLELEAMKLNPDGTTSA